MGEKTEITEQKVADKKPLWTVKNGVLDKGEWIDLDQINQSLQIRLWNNLFDISFRVYLKFDGTYVLGEVGEGKTNIYHQLLLRESKTDTENAYKTIVAQLQSGLWTDTNMKGLMDFGVVEGIFTKLLNEDKENGTNTSKEFLSNPVINAMKDIEWQEYFLFQSFKTDEEMLEYLEGEIQEEKENGKLSAISLMYQKFKSKVEKEVGEPKQLTEKDKVVKKTPGEDILDYCIKNGYGLPDLITAVTMMADLQNVKNVRNNVRRSMEGQNKGSYQPRQ